MEVMIGKSLNFQSMNKMGYAARIWGLIIGAYILIISGMIMNGNLIWTDKLQQLEAAQTRVITFDAS